ncbi:HAD family phosphatase [Soonwooa sp.]|uniref:HAD family hydrolase n=1 Tax=Soonwooa sp. TaxID=1938592 RepID=UPI0028A07A2D|nr:HAD family phosphatase [Soonwooa sp.]
MKLKNIIFDFGGVLMDWDPRYYFRTHFDNEADMDFFLKNIATNAWNIEQDRGRTLERGTEKLIKEHPLFEKDIRAYYDNWTTMLRGEIPQNVAVLRQLEGKYPLYGLTNWSAETFPYALENYDFFKLFGGKIVVSGDEKLIKPDPKIFKVLLKRYDLKAEESVFIDDNIDNIKTAESLGFTTIHVTPETDLANELHNLGYEF